MENKISKPKICQLDRFNPALGEMRVVAIVSDQFSIIGRIAMDSSQRQLLRACIV
jgi:hypothetical protein